MDGEASCRPPACERRRSPAPLLACVATLGESRPLCVVRCPKQRVCVLRRGRVRGASTLCCTDVVGGRQTGLWLCVCGAAAAAACLAGTRRFDRSQTVLAGGGGGPVAAAAKAFHARGEHEHAVGGAAQKGAYRCFVVDGKAQCVEAPTNSQAKREIIEIGKNKVPTTMIKPQRLAEIKEDIAANQKAADRLLADEGWAGMEKSQKNMAALIAAKIRGLSRMVGTLRESHEGIVQELIAKAAAPGPPVRVSMHACSCIRACSPDTCCGFVNVARAKVSVLS